MRRITAALALALLLGAGASARAEEGAPPEGPMQPEEAVVYDELARRMLQGSLSALSRPETTALLARYVRNFHQALVAEGFSEKQALQIVIGIGLPRLR